MFGDGLGLTPGEVASIWTDLATRDAIKVDSYSNGGSVERLETAFAEILGKERAVFMPTGTLANHLAVRALADGKGRTVVQAESHLYNDSGDCVQTLSNIPLVPLGTGRASFTLTELEKAVDRANNGRVKTAVRVISIETPVRRRFGEIFNASELEQIVGFAKQNSIRLHLDGARIFLQAAYEQRQLADYAAPFDTVYVSLYKYFNAPSGAILAGPRSLLDTMFQTRRMFGAGLPAAWPFAALAHHYLPGFLDRYRSAIEVSKQWLARIERHDAFRVEHIPNGTNLFHLRVTGNATRLRQRLRENGVVLGTLLSGNRFLISVNETWNLRSADELENLFAVSIS